MDLDEDVAPLLNQSRTTRGFKIVLRQRATSSYVGNILAVIIVANLRRLMVCSMSKHAAICGVEIR